MARIRFDPRSLPSDLDVLGDTSLLDVLLHMSTDDQDFSFTIMAVNLNNLGVILLFLIQAGERVQLSTQHIADLRIFGSVETGDLKLDAERR